MGDDRAPTRGGTYRPAGPRADTTVNRMTEGGPSDLVAGVGVPVGTAAARLGVTSSTLRSWGTRYGLVPSLRTAGGHRRYSAADLALLDEVRDAIRAGVAPAVAAREALRGADPPRGPAPPAVPTGGGSDRPRRGAGPGGRVLAVPGADATTRGLARTVGQLDLAGAEEVVLRGLRDRGAIATWEELLRPVLVAVGKRWAEHGDGIEVEHVLSEATMGALRRRRGELPAVPARPPVLLAAAPGDQHVLALHTLAVALPERDLPVHLLGAPVPLATLATVARRTRPGAVFVSSTIAGGLDPHELVAAVPRTRPRTPVVVGGHGWPRLLPAGLEPAPDLGTAADLLVQLLGSRPDR